jgi:eukaryotic-like serine/threonine-protein kinase
MPTNFDLMILPLSGNRKPYPFLQTPFNEMHGKFSPDGKWVVFGSDKSGRFEVYVRSFEHPDQSEFQVSTSGGQLGEWRNDGKEIIFDSYADNRIMAVDVMYGPRGLELGAPHALFLEPPRSIAGTYLPNFSRFLFAVNTAEEQSSLPLNLVTNWPAILQH